jgi:hypothetical protein
MNFILINQIHIVTEKYIITYNIFNFVHVWKNYNYINQEVGLSY